MNYEKLLYKAHENNKNASNKPVRCYKTTFAPPKKLERSKVSSDNIKKFLARREEEDRKKRDEATRKKEELLALRSQDKKAQRRVQVMLKSTKSANKSVMADAIDNVNTADTLLGFKQCDEDDYGYVSQEASAFYTKLLNKYENMPPEPSKFQNSPKKEVKDLNAAKDRVRAALQKEADEELMPHKRKKRKRDNPNENEEGQESKKLCSVEPNEPEVEKKEEKKIKPRKISAPPPMDFNKLMQIAEKKQFEPILIDESLLKKEPERLMTKKEKLEYEKEVLRKSSKGREPSKTVDIPSKNDMKLKGSTDLNKQDQKKKKDTNVTPKETRPEGSSTIKDKKKTLPAIPINKGKSDHRENLENQKKDGRLLSQSTSNIHSDDLEAKVKGLVPKITKSTKVGKIEKKVETKTKGEEPVGRKIQQETQKDVKVKELELQLMKERNELLATKLRLKELELKSMEAEKKESKKKVEKVIPKKVKKPVVKRRIDSESEYDSELEDFIDDGPDEGNDYSKYITEIFGYDKSRYSQIDDADECMESNFAQISKEEFVSTKIGIMEDLEDIRKEQEEKKRLKDKKLKRLAEEKKRKKK